MHRQPFIQKAVGCVASMSNCGECQAQRLGPKRWASSQCHQAIQTFEAQNFLRGGVCAAQTLSGVKAQKFKKFQPKLQIRTEASIRPLKFAIIFSYSKDIDTLCSVDASARIRRLHSQSSSRLRAVSTRHKRVTGLLVVTGVQASVQNWPRSVLWRSKDFQLVQSSNSRQTGENL